MKYTLPVVKTIAMTALVVFLAVNDFDTLRLFSIGSVTATTNDNTIVVAGGNKRTTVLPLMEKTSVEKPFSDIQTIKVLVKPGDNLSLIFSRLKLSQQSLSQIIALGDDVKVLSRILPNKKLEVKIQDDVLIGLNYEIDVYKSLSVSRQDQHYKAQIIEHKIDKVTRQTQVTITHSVFMSGQKAQLSDNIIAKLIGIFAWDIDFALDIREGDHYTIIYEELYRDGIKICDGEILAVKFNNNGRSLLAFRYTDHDNKRHYFNEEGEAMAKTFLRNPVDFTRISSHFNLRRKHPILNTVRAHKGIDYAAPTGTPIRATADGRIAFVGTKGGYGKMIVLSHQNNYSTAYAHLSRYAKGLKAKRRVEQGQIIGYVGSTGMSTGPHLHYEFRVNGVHKNPLTVPLPKADSIDEAEYEKFSAAILPLLHRLNNNLLVQNDVD